MLSFTYNKIHRNIPRPPLPWRSILRKPALNFSTLPPTNQHPKLLSDRRYRIFHKLGWGGYSTVWAARVRLEENYVAIKICMIDHFDLDGPNGTHQCLVFELLGPNIPDLIEACFSIGRLPGKLARDVSKQALIGLDFLHQQTISHGGNPEIGTVHRNDGKALEPGISTYIVRPVRTSTSWPLSNTIKIIDFGESFSPQTVPQTLHTPLTVRAPEVIFGDRLDYRVDLWSLGCMLFELLTGQPPFDRFLITPKILAGQMQEITTMEGDAITDTSGPELQEWLEVYFDHERTADLTREDIAKLGQIIGMLLHFKPSARATTREVLSHPWFRD
ncbi:kinase-like protein [Aspergillus ellipticus CBS 707.79]|uniref:Kinase-like protein n=1 Tax=Aspergillus ellipticus CBS 707.79 TaxID=1448320 RepID=A0A319EXQ7_9EURO|nr:kinase-like protein [Aspergillus ellipticus CBS 707.79]